MLGLGRTQVIVVIIIQVFLAIEVCWAFMFIRNAIEIVSCQYLVDVTGRILVQLLVVPEYDDGHIDRTEHG